MKIGLIGLPNSGKTTVFNALTRQNAEVTSYTGGRADTHIAVVPVLDERVDRLSALYLPRKTVYASVDFSDFAGLSEDSARDGGFPPQTAALMRTSDALALVLRNFTHPDMNPPDPIKELDRLEEELLLSDLILVENRQERIEAQLRRCKKTHELGFEQKTLRILHQHLNEGRPLRELKLASEEEKLIRGFGLFTCKPLLIVLNSDESRFGCSDELRESLQARHGTVEFSGKFEMELAHLDEEDSLLFREEMGINSSARERLLSLAYMTVGYISFFTVGQDEVRAWNILKGKTALDAAGVIHSDLARGFIRAERFTYQDLISTGSEKAVREKGRMSLEGRDYIVGNGDILNIRFSV